jgi:hypothetical protein
VAVTVTWGGAMSGYAAIPIVVIEMAPPRQISIEMTHAKIGRSMKKLGMTRIS